MAKFSSLLSLRMKQKDSQKPKMTALVKQSNEGNLSSFSGLFQVSPISEKEKNILEELLNNFQANKEYDIKNDLEILSNITSEVKAITNQAVMLHGERISKAQSVLKNYNNGAFTAWLITTYGNRQTPYNFLQYYDFCSKMPNHLLPIIDEMPRQAVYTLASRTGENTKKEEIIKNYNGESKKEMLNIIRNQFPLNRDDKRLPNIANQSISSLIRLKILFKHSLFETTDQQKNKIYQLLDELFSLIKNQ